MGLFGETGAQLIAYLFFAWWGYWTLGIILWEPWMLTTHMPTKQMAFVPRVSLGDMDSIVIESKGLQLPRWDSVKTYSLRFFATFRPTGKGDDDGGSEKDVSMRLAECTPRFVLLCKDVNNRALIFMDLGNVTRTATHYKEVKHILTPEPFPAAVDRDYSSPQCTLRMDSKCPFHYKTAVRASLEWQLHITPHWHWTDWFPRDFAEGVFDTANAMSAYLHVAPPPAHWRRRAETTENGRK